MSTKIHIEKNIWIKGCGEEWKFYASVRTPFSTSHGGTCSFGTFGPDEKTIKEKLIKELKAKSEQLREEAKKLDQFINCLALEENINISEE